MKVTTAWKQLQEDELEGKVRVIGQAQAKVGRTCFTTFPWDPNRVRNSVRLLAGLGEGRYKMEVLVRAGVPLQAPIETVATLAEALHGS